MREDLDRALALIAALSERRVALQHTVAEQIRLLQARADAEDWSARRVRALSSSWPAIKAGARHLARADEVIESGQVLALCRQSCPL